MRPILFIDRDGTIIKEIMGENMDSIEKVTFLPGVLRYLRKIQAETNFFLAMVTNQDGLGTSGFPEADFWPVHHLIMRTLEGEEIVFDAVHIDEHYESDNHPNRKPGIGMLTNYLEGGFDLENSYVIGDRLTDVELSENLGCNAIHIFDQKSSNAVLTTENWKDIYEFLKSK